VSACTASVANGVGGSMRGWAVLWLALSARVVEPHATTSLIIIVTSERTAYGRRDRLMTQD